MRLTGQQFGRVHDALLDAFPSREALAELTQRGLGRHLDEFRGDGGHRDTVLRMIQWCGARDRVVELLRAATSIVPDNRSLRYVAESLGVVGLAAPVGDAPLTLREAPSPEMADGLEQVVRTYGISVDAGAFVDRMVTSLGRVCLVRIGGQDTATGFLVGPDLLLTNYHVLKPVIAGATEPAAVSFVFDYRTRDGAVSEGPGVGLRAPGAAGAGVWLVDGTDCTLEERKRYAPSPDITRPTDPAHLDFALVRLDRAIGAEAGPGGGARGHFRLDPAEKAFDFPAGTPLIIVGHPEMPGTDPLRCQPQVFAIEPDAVIAKNPNGTRVHYRTNTFAGSSGSPVLSARWELVALHHFGKARQYNQGVPTAAIAARPAVAAALAP